MMETCADIYQPFRMTIVWPIIVGGYAFLAFRLIVTWISGTWTRQQAMLAGLTGLAAAVVATSISNRWDGSEFYWLAFTAGLTFAAIVIILTVVFSFWQANND